MIKAKNPDIPENVVESKFILVKNTCYIDNFTLRFFSNPEISSEDINSTIPIRKLDYEFKSRHNKPLQSSLKIIKFQGKLSIDRPGTLEEGNLELKWNDEKHNLIIIKMRFELVDNIAIAYEFELFFKEIDEIFQKIRNLYQSSKNQKKLDYFLMPHLIGTKNLMSKLKTPQIVSYSLDNDQLKIFGYKNEDLQNYINPYRANENEEISTKISIEDIEYSLYWDIERKHWGIKEDISKIPKKGVLIIKPKIDSDIKHNEKKALYSHESLIKLNNDPDSEGNKILRLAFSQDESESEKTNFKPTLEELRINKELEMPFKRLNSTQKEIISDFSKYSIVFINGDAGTGKTEVAAILSLIYAENGNKILISSEKNEAINNLYLRIINFIENSEDLKKRMKIARFIAKSHTLHNDKLNKYELDNQIGLIRDNIKKTCSINSDNPSINNIKQLFMQSFTKKEILQCLISKTYDIIISTFGNICQQRSLSQDSLKYDLSIIEASSSVTLSQASIGVNNSKKWLFLNDQDQVDPLTPEMFLLKEPLRFPDKNEIENAMKYDPSDLNLKKGKINWGNVKYKEGVSNLFKNIDENAHLKHYTLKEQFRINPKLYRFLCKIFKKEFIPSKDEFSNSKLNSFAELFPSDNNFKYEVLSKNEIPIQMGAKINQFVELINSKKTDDAELTIGIACTDVNSLIKVISNYQLITKGEVSPSKKPSYYQDINKGSRLVFSSIDNHQEHEYDIFILGIVNSRGKSFKKRLYTALTRASKFAIVYGPNIRSSLSPYRNIRLLKELQDGGC